MLWCGPWLRNDGSRTLVKPKVSGAKLQTRIVSALVLGGFGGFVTLSGGLVWALWMSLTSFLSAREYFTMTATMTSELPHPQPKWASDLCIVLCASLSTVLHLAGNKLTILVMLTTGAFSVVATLLITKQENPHFAQFCATLFGIFYCGFLPAFWVKLRALAINGAAAGSKKLVATNMNISGGSLVESWPAALGGPEVWTTGLVVTIIAVFCIVSADVGAYCFGKTFGKHQLTAISPNKTIEGAAGGLLSVVATAFGLRYLLGWHAGVIQTMCLGVVIFWASVSGDLIESVMKRNAGMKDSGDIIPGHGGFLDRFDSYMFTGVSVYFYIVTVMPQWFQGIVL